MTKIGEAKRVLSDAIRDECGEFRDRLDELSERAVDLGCDSTGINGFSAYWRGLHQQLQAMANTVEEKQKEVLASLEGKPKHEIQVRLDPEQVDRVKAAQDNAA